MAHQQREARAAMKLTDRLSCTETDELIVYVEIPQLYSNIHTFSCEHEVEDSSTTLRTLCDIMNVMPSSKVMFSEVFTLLRLVLTIPVTTATAERTFSTLRRLKNFLRSSVTQPQLNHTILLPIHKKGLIV